MYALRINNQACGFSGNWTQESLHSASRQVCCSTSTLGNYWSRPNIPGFVFMVWLNKTLNPQSELNSSMMVFINWLCQVQFSDLCSGAHLYNQRGHLISDYCTYTQNEELSRATYFKVLSKRKKKRPCKCVI